YGNARNAERKQMLDELREQTEAQLTEWLKENQKDMIKSINRIDLAAAQKAGNRPSTNLDNPRANGAPLNGIYPDWYTFLQDVFLRQKNALNDEGRERMKAVQNYSEKVPAEGGLLVPEEFRSEVMRLAMENSVVRPRATIIPMGGPRVHIPMVD